MAVCCIIRLRACLFKRRIITYIGTFLHLFRERKPRIEKGSKSGVLPSCFSIFLISPFSLPHTFWNTGLDVWKFRFAVMWFLELIFVSNSMKNGGYFLGWQMLDWWEDDNESTLWTYTRQRLGGMNDGSDTKPFTLSFFFFYKRGGGGGRLNRGNSYREMTVSWQIYYAAIGWQQQ